jgi:RNA polymerase sigma-70 factor (ECF subfamily)
MARNDAELVLRAREGDQEAFALLVDRYRDMVYGLGYHLTGDFEAARDLAQEAFVQAFLHLGQLCEPDKFGGWLRAIATNAHHSARRHKEVATVALEEGSQVAEARAPGSEIEAVVREALGHLRDPERLALTLHYINGYSHAEIGAFLGVRAETVKTRLARARQSLHKEVISMVEDTFGSKKLPDDFTQETIEAAVAVAQAHLEQGRIGAAIEQYEAVLRRDEDYVPALAGLGHAHCEVGQYDKAIPYLRRALERDPENREAFRDLHWILQITQKYEELLVIQQELLRREPSANNHFGVAAWYEGLGRLEEAERHYRAAIEMDPSYTRARQQLAWLARAQGRDEEALAVLREAIEKDPNDEWTFLALTEINYEAGRYEEAIENVQHALLMKGKGYYCRSVERFLSWLERLCHETGQLDAFPGLCRRLRDQVGPGEYSDRIQWCLAFFLESRLQRAEAIQEFERLGVIPAHCWRVLGPFDNAGGQGMLTAYPPEQEIDLDKSYVGPDGRHLRWRRPMWEGAGFVLDFNPQLYRWGLREGAVSYGLLDIVSPEERQAVFRFGAWEWAQIWLNGQSIYMERSGPSPEQEAAPLTLKRGDNQLLIKVGVRDWHASHRAFHYQWAVLARITDKDGEPLRDLQFPLAENP